MSDNLLKISILTIFICVLLIGMHTIQSVQIYTLKEEVKVLQYQAIEQATKNTRQEKYNVLVLEALGQPSV